jgi:hypothetical protein
MWKERTTAAGDDEVTHTAMMHELEAILHGYSQDMSKYWKDIVQDRSLLWYIISSDAIDVRRANILFTLTWNDANDSLRDRPGESDRQRMHAVVCALYGRHY